MNNKKGFTLVELLAVIVILAIIMVIAIPSILSTMGTAKKKSFVEFANKAALKAQEKYTSRSLEGLPVRGTIIYDIAKDLDLSNIGDYKGYVIVDATESNSTGFYVYLYDSEYFLDITRSNDIDVDLLLNVDDNVIETDIDKLASNAGYDSYYVGSSSTIIETVDKKYEFLDSINLNGDKYINTNIIPTDNTKVEIVLLGDEFDAIIGSRTKYLSNDSYTIFGGFSKLSINYIAYWGDKSLSVNEKLTTLDGGLKVYFGDKTINVSDKIVKTFNNAKLSSTKYPMFLFSVSNAGAPDYRVFKGTFYSCKLYEGDDLIRNYVAAKIKATGELIIYDKVQKKEYHFIKYNK